GPRARLGVPLTPDLLGGEDPGQVAAPLLLGAMRDERRADHLDAHHADEPRSARADHLLVHDGLSHDVGALAAILGGPAEREVPRGVDLALPRLGARDALPVGRAFHRIVAPRVFRNVPLEPGADLALEGELVGGIGEVHRRRCLARTPRPSPPRTDRAHAVAWKA